MDLDDRQQFMHAMRTLVECANVLREELDKYPFKPEDRSEMMLAYWRASVNSAFTPDFGRILSKLIPSDE